jgi:hypothetical protein
MTIRQNLSGLNGLKSSSEQAPFSTTSDMHSPQIGAHNIPQQLCLKLQRKVKCIVSSHHLQHWMMYNHTSGSTRAHSLPSRNEYSVAPPVIDRSHDRVPVWREGAHACLPCQEHQESKINQLQIALHVVRIYLRHVSPALTKTGQRRDGAGGSVGPVDIGSDQVGAQCFPARPQLVAL